MFRSSEEEPGYVLKRSLKKETLNQQRSTSELLLSSQRLL